MIDLTNQKSSLIVAVEAYIEKNRNGRNDEYYPVWHAAPPIGWINDPNGFIFFRGQYHLYCQYHPYSSEWGPMYWGHWVSTDLVRWEWAGVALAPDTPADRGGCFSGTALVRDGVLYVLYTGLSEDGKGGYFQLQCMARSEDGFHFEKCADNPVIDQTLLPSGASSYDFRDPKVFIGTDGRFYCLTACKLEGKGSVLRFVSEDLVSWCFDGCFYSSPFDMLECPDLAEHEEYTSLLVGAVGMPLAKERFPQKSRSVFVRGRLRDGELEKDSAVLYTDYGWDLYAPECLFLRDGRCVMIGWLSCWAHHMPTSPLGHRWNGCMSIPREIFFEDGTLIQKPIREMEKLRGTGICVNGFGKMETPIGSSSEILIMMMPDSKEPSMIRICNAENESIKIRLCPAEGEMYFDFRESGLSVCSPEELDVSMQTSVSCGTRYNKELKLRIYLDLSSFECFIGNGEYVVSQRVFPRKPYTSLNISAGAPENAIHIEYYPLAFARDPFSCGD